VVSQDCNIVHSSYDSEPYVEVAIAREMDREDGNLLHGKNPRRLQFRTSDGKLHEINIHDVQRLDRHVLVARSPDNSVYIDDETVRQIGRWLGKRYTRPAFPDSFNERIRSAQPKIASKLKSHGALITGLYLRLSTNDELPPSQIYGVDLRVTARADTLEDESLEAQLLSVVAYLEKYLNGCEGVEAEVRLDSEGQFTLEDRRLTQRWDYDYLSDRNPEGSGAPPEE
jgi:hypothetical protein